MNRRGFLAGSAAATAATFTATASSAPEKPALLGGRPVRAEPFPGWPVMDQREDRALLDVLHSGKWFRGHGGQVSTFESAYARLTGARHCLATANGTSALVTSLAAAGVEPGDEVIVPPYTFIATVNAVLLHHALPVFVDTDPETFQIDARKLESALTDRTTAVVPVHLGGNVADLDAILDITGRRKLKLIEDACQSHLAEWRGRHVGTWGDAGCFSFQVSKNLPSGEGGAILARDDDLIERCYAFHNNGNARSSPTPAPNGRAANLRLTEFQGALLLAQMTRLQEQSKTREQNARYLTGLLDKIPGIRPARQYTGCTRNAYHLYMFRYDPEPFGGLPRAGFLKALAAEGIPGSAGYSPLNRQPFLREALASKGFRRIYPQAVLDAWADRNQCPANDLLCQEAVWLTQPMLLGPRTDMDQIAEAIRKLQSHGAELARA